MIYVTVGNHDQPFDRLLRAMDELAPRIGEKVVMQTGFCRYVPRNAEHFPFVPFARQEDTVRNAVVVVGHAGIGTVISARKFGTPLVICPRRRDRGEHFNDHQLEICNELLAHPRPMVEVALETEELEGKLALLQSGGRGTAEAQPAAELSKTIREFLAAL